MHSIKLTVQSFIRQAANKLLDICALPQLCEAWLALRALWKMICLLDPFGGMVPRKWIYDFMLPLGMERNMGDANDGNRTRVFFLAGIDHSKGRGCRVMFPEVVGQFKVKDKRSHSSLQWHSVVYVHRFCFVIPAEWPMFCILFCVCVCVACAAAIGRNSLRPLVAALEGLSEIEEACACWTVFVHFEFLPRMHAKSEGSYAHATSGKLIYFISSCIFDSMRDMLVICDLVAICCNNDGQLQTGNCTHAGFEQNWQGHCLSSRNFVAILSVAPRWDNGNYRIQSSEQYALRKYNWGVFHSKFR